MANTMTHLNKLLFASVTATWLLMGCVQPLPSGSGSGDEYQDGDQDQTVIIYNTICSLDVSPAKLDFGDVAVDDSMKESFNVHNNCTVDQGGVTLDLTVTLTDSGQFDVDTASILLNPTSQTTIWAEFIPDSLGQATSTVYLDSSVTDAALGLIGVGVNDDADGDGYTEDDGDCDDTDPDINPGEDDIPDDGIDQDCSGSDAVCTEWSASWSVTAAPSQFCEDLGTYYSESWNGSCGWYEGDVWYIQDGSTDTWNESSVVGELFCFPTGGSEPTLIYGVEVIEDTDGTYNCWQATGWVSYYVIRGSCSDWHDPE